MGTQRKREDKAVEGALRGGQDTLDAVVKARLRHRASENSSSEKKHREDGTTPGSTEYAGSPLSKARGHLDKQVERGDHSPKVGGHSTSQHGGRVPNNEVSHSFANEPEDNLKGSKGSGYRD